jgi:hypothetical protein
MSRLVGVRIRQRFEHHAVDDAENGARGADPNGQCYQYNQREQGTSPQHSKAVPQVMREGLDEIGCARFAALVVD